MNNFYEKGLFAPILNKKKYRVMKITVAILTFALFHVAAIASYAQSAKVNLNVTNEEFYKLKYCSTVVYMVPRA